MQGVVTWIAQQTAYAARFMVVVNAKAFLLRRFIAECAYTALSLEHFLVLLDGDSIPAQFARENRPLSLGRSAVARINNRVFAGGPIARLSVIAHRDFLGR
jgi:hypothetical protein